MKRYSWRSRAWARHLGRAALPCAVAAITGCSGDGFEGGPGPGRPLSHPIEGTYDVTVHFTTQTTRGGCVPPGPDLYCYTTVSVDITKTGTLVIDDASATSGAAQLDVVFDFEGRSHVVMPGATAPSVDAAGHLRAPALYAAGFSVTMEGTLVNATIEGTISSGYSVMGSHGGTFTAVRRP